MGPGFRKFLKLPTLRLLPPTNNTLELKIHNWKSWAYTDGSCSVLDGKQVIGGGVYQPSTNKINLLGLTST